MNKKSLLFVVKTLLPLALGAYLFWLFFSKMTDEHILSFKKAISEANYFWIILSLVISFLALCSRAIRWKYMLEAMDYKTSFWNRYHAVMIGYLVNFTVPRAGEASRAAMLYRSDGIPFSKSFGTIIGERIFDLIMLATVTAITMLIGYDDLMNLFSQITNLSTDSEGTNSSSLKMWILIGGLIFMLSMSALIYFNKNLRAKVISFVKDMIAGVLSIFKSKHPIAFIGHTVFIWLCYIAMFIVPFFALKETSDFPVSGYLIGFIAGSVGISLTNGGIGIYPLLVGIVVSYYLTPIHGTEAEGIGKALGMLMWSSQTILLILLGLLSLVLLPKNYSNEPDTSIKS